MVLTLQAPACFDAGTPIESFFCPTGKLMAGNTVLEELLFQLDSEAATKSLSRTSLSSLQAKSGNSSTKLASVKCPGLKLVERGFPDGPGSASMFYNEKQSLEVWATFPLEVAPREIGAPGTAGDTSGGPEKDSEDTPDKSAAVDLSVGSSESQAQLNGPDGP